MGNRVWIFVLASLLLFGVAPAMAGAKAASTTATAVDTNKQAAPVTVTVTAVDTNKKTISWQTDGQTVTAGASAISSWINRISVGQSIKVQWDSGSKTVYSLAALGVSPWSLFGTLVAAFAIILFFACLASGFQPLQFMIGTDGRYSNSKVQIVLWFWTVIAAYLATMALRVWVGGFDYLGHIAIPTELMTLTGLSALTYGGAKAITTQKVDSATADGSPNPKGTADKPSLFSDLFQNDVGEADIGDFQMILIVLIAVVTYVLTIWNYLSFIDISPTTTLPNVDTTLLSAFGVGQGAYLVKKLASDPGQG